MCRECLGVSGCGTRMQYATVFSNLDRLFIKLIDFMSVCDHFSGGFLSVLCVKFCTNSVNAIFRRLKSDVAFKNVYPEYV